MVLGSWRVGALGGCADGFGVGGSFFLHGSLSGELDTVLVVDEDDFDADLVAELDDVLDVFDVAVGEFGDMAESVGIGGDFDEGAEFADADDLSVVDSSDLDLGGHGFDEVASPLSGGGIDGADVDGSVVLDVDLCFGFFLDLLDIFAAGSDELSDLLGIDLDGEESRGPAADFFSRLGEYGGHLVEDDEASFFGPQEGIADDVVGEAFDFDIELDGGDSIPSSADFEVHVTEVVFFAGDVGEEGAFVSFLNESDGDASDGLGDGYSGVHECEAAAAGAGHGAGAVGFEDIGDDADGVGEGFDVREDGEEGSFGESAVSDFAASGAADGAYFTHAVTGEVVVEHEFLGVFFDEAIDELFVGACSEGDDAEGLGFAAGEDGGAVDAWEDADFGGDGSDGVEVAAVGSDAFEDGFAGDLFFDVDEDCADFFLFFAVGDDESVGGVGVCAGWCEVCDDVIHDLLDGVGAVLFAGLSFDFADACGCELADLFEEFGVVFDGGADLWAADFLDKLFDHFDDLDADVVSELDGVGDDIFGDFAGSDFDHIDEVLGSGDDEVEVGDFELVGGGEEDELAIDAADADVGSGVEEGDIADGDGGTGGDAGEDIGVVLLVGSQDVEVDLDLIHETFWEEGSEGAIDQSCGEDFLGGWAPFAFHETAGEFSSGGAAFAVVNLEGEEIDAFSRVGTDDGAEDDGVGVLDGNCAVGKLGECSGFNR